MAVNIHITIIELKALHTKRQNLFYELDAVIHLLMEDKHLGLRKSRNATSLNSRFKSLDTLKVKIISVTFRRVIFFFQAEDGIRDHCVTGVQTCALPILQAYVARRGYAGPIDVSLQGATGLTGTLALKANENAGMLLVSAGPDVAPGPQVIRVVGKAKIEKIGRASCRERGESREGEEGIR